MTLKDVIRQHLSQMDAKKSKNKALPIHQKRILEEGPLVKKEGATRHFCTFFVPIHIPSRSIYLGHHIKADDWIPPGGHIEMGELPLDTVKREMLEELQHKITDEKIIFFNISHKVINRPEQRCMEHFDLWHTVEMNNMPNFVFERKEYYDAGWFPIDEALSKIKKNDDFKEVLASIFDRI
ncbi:MAG: NUDIX hydrolase [Patescibacteria group bacterium]